MCAHTICDPSFWDLGSCLTTVHANESLIVYSTYNSFFSGHIPKICFLTNVTVAVFFQLAFVSDEVLPPKLSYNYTFIETTYTLYTNSFLNFGQVSCLYPHSSTL
jgi:hypothetical protein